MAPLQGAFSPCYLPLRNFERIPCCAPCRQQQSRWVFPFVAAPRLFPSLWRSSAGGLPSELDDRGTPDFRKTFSCRSIPNDSNRNVIFSSCPHATGPATLPLLSKGSFPIRFAVRLFQCTWAVSVAPIPTAEFTIKLRYVVRADPRGVAQTPGSFPT